MPGIHRTHPPFLQVLCRHLDSKGGTPTGREHGGHELSADEWNGTLRGVPTWDSALEAEDMSNHLPSYTAVEEEGDLASV